ncbi:uncharacterized protein LOC116267178 [Nymphaea colorata]|nr:uncharacterized protein LOC116267178 [Nymphaea colorata]
MEETRTALTETSRDNCSLLDVQGVGKRELENRNFSDPSPSSDDDWEAVADRATNELYHDIESRASKLSLDLSASHFENGPSKNLVEEEAHAPKQRGRGSFMYGKNGLYSDQYIDDADGCCSEDEMDHECQQRTTENENKKTQYGMDHTLVLSGFPSSTRTTELEKDFDSFRDRGVSIRWVDDTTALAVFRTPALAWEAHNSVHCSYSIRVLDENDPIISSISSKDLDPPHPRPKTSARTAQRLIAQGMGQKPCSNFSAYDLRKQEEARRNRIQMRQKLRDDAWGDEVP